MSWRDEHRTTTVPPVEPAGPDASSQPPGPPPLSLWRKVVLVLIGVALVGGLVGLLVTRRFGSSAEQGGPAGTVPLQQTTLATTLAQSDQPPPLLNTGEDWNAIARSMIAYDYWLQLHPRPELLDEYMLPTNKDYANSKLGLTNLAAKGWHFDPIPSPVVVQHVEVTTRMSPTLVGVVIRFGPAPEYRVVDQTGRVVQDKPATADGNTVEWTLAQYPGDPHWRLADVMAL